ncbi:E3 ubiquitin-protein ligase PPP1R11-like isoform X1 [Leguminivora glycinivorella]|uniref:E3 ubiquitin-protein ligase PPP1R11-like isoform X1 n=1 Tax=Leguminivora glycinivorella TaxID=1035111 RepID=UPI00200F74A7|nr:E3 ubiquitin-protein ligase PPP1R11-like isoform X1 [Leguminivora glycinivorella]
MGERLQPEDMATTSTAVATVSSQIQEPAEPVAVITLRPRKSRKKVVWTDDTVDNEHMNKKKSKCCCIYEKPKAFGESDSEDSDDECEHCFGHVEKRHKQAGGSTVTTDEQDGATHTEPTASLTLQPAPVPAPAPAEPAPAPAPHN